MGRKLLVADDSVTIQKVIKLALSSEGYDILAVSDGKEAIRAIQEERPDVVLIDVALVGADAYAVKRATNQNPSLANVSFILMASAFERVDEKSVDELKFHGRLIKPFDPSHLRKAVSELMAKAGAASAAPPPAVSVTPPPLPPSVPESVDDLPPVKDMHPTLADEPPKPMMTEEEFHLDPPVSLAPPSPAPPPPPKDEETEAIENEAVATKTLENDIKDLTESTIKMSGLDDFQWNLDDSKKMKSEPPRAEPTREVPRPNNALKSVISAPSRAIDDGGTTFPFSSAAPKETTKETNLRLPPQPPPPDSNLVSGRDYVPPTIELKREPTNPGILSPHAAAAAHGAGAATAPQAPISRAEMEQMIRDDLNKMLEKMLRDIVPQIAENVIRKEIEKILAET